MATSPIYSWPEPDNTDLVKNGALAIRTMGNAIDTTMGTMVAKTIIDAKGDLIAGTAADTAARLAVGNNGETLVADSLASTGLRWAATPSASNPVLNSAFQIAQRGTSFTNPTSLSTYSLDRWQIYSAGASGRTFSRQTTSDTTNLPNIQYCMRVARDSGNTLTDALYLWQAFETVNSIPYTGKTVTMSFYARRGANYSATSNFLGVQLIGGTGTDQNGGISYTGAVDIIYQNATLTTTWQRFTFTATVGSTITEITPYFQRGAVGTAGAADFFEITGVQIDIGSVALPFRTQNSTIQGELAACQRYYFRMGGDSNYQAFGIGIARSTSVFDPLIPFPVQMRVAPTALDYNLLASVPNYSGVATSISSIGINSASKTYYLINATSSATPFTAQSPYYLAANNSTSAYLGFSSEL